MTTKHGKRRDFRTGKEKVERYVKVLLRPVAEGGLALHDGWVPLEQLRFSVKALAKRAVSEEFLRTVIKENQTLALSEDSTMARSLRIDETEGRFATPNEVMYAYTTLAGLAIITKQSFVDTPVYTKPSPTSAVVLRVAARRAETLGAKFFHTKHGPEQLRAVGVPVECLTQLRDRGV